MANTMIPACVQDERNSKVLRIGFVTDETISKMENSKVVMLHNPATGSVTQKCQKAHTRQSFSKAVRLRCARR